MKYIIVAYDKKYGIGANNDLLWHNNLPADLKHFKQCTTDNAIIMGWNTYKSIRRPLPGRQNVIISDFPVAIEGFDVVDNLQSAYKIVEPGKDAYVIGGGYVYAEAIDTVDEILATEVDAEFKQATVFFPEIDKNIWHEVSRQDNTSDENNTYNYSFVTYAR